MPPEAAKIAKTRSRRFNEPVAGLPLLTKLYVTRYLHSTPRPPDRVEPKPTHIYQDPLHIVNRGEEATPARGRRHPVQLQSKRSQVRERWRHGFTIAAVAS